jgi:hypothetical protein
MASKRQRRANQKNARRSTGPQTAAGKANAAQNSFRHGLAADIRNNSTCSKDIEALAQHYWEETLNRHRFVDARTAAEAQFAINRVRQARVALIENAAVDQETDSSVTGTDHDGQVFSAIFRVAEKLLQFDRYERRALSRRKKALKELFRP